MKTSSEKSVRLEQAAEQRRLNQELEDEKLWLNEIETLLCSTDIGETLADANFLLRKQQVQWPLISVRVNCLEVVIERNHGTQVQVLLEG